ncbi:ABC transporter permease [Deinococcus deserti]|uniref:Autoinducer 2 import system permease protein LsrD n=1 Tax=Deinococcus deserti (strain DSM 17065 / CIP 109153 / LMG 22923 / VCD115) TaxID=546414 RepID=C1D3L2_DEIDV|nr:ABC transporter permease [Deinococcus deserti]ACO48091.1 putative ribose/xylose/arabinose/galactoside ABC transporter, permease component [Deinococcus deserti VCD115]
MSVPNRPRRSLLGWESTILALVVVALLMGSALHDAFLTGPNLSNLTSNLVEIALIALTMTLVVIAAEIDLSVASIVGMCSALLGVLWAAQVPMPLAILATLTLGALAGFLNGWLVTRLGLPSLAVTIGTLALYRGLAYALLGDRAVADFPPFWTNLGFGLVPGTQIPIPAVAFVLLAIITAVVLHATPFGRSLYAIGANEVAARFAGLRVERTKLLLFILSGLMSAFAAVIYTFRFSSARADNAAGLELAVIAAVLLGGVSIFGGRGSVIGVIAAVFLIGIIQNALTLADVPNEILTIVTGLLLILSVLGPNLAARFKTARQQRLNTQPQGGTL